MTSELFAAVERGDAARAEALLKGSAASADERGEGGYTALMLAAFAGDVRLMDVLLAHGADPNAKNDGGTAPAKLAAMNGHAAALRLLAKAGADPDAADAKGFTPLMYAAMNGHEAAVRTLVECGANAAQASAAGKKTAADFAREKGRAELAGFLETAAKAPPAAPPAPAAKEAAEIRAEELIGQQAAKTALGQVIALAKVNQERLRRHLPGLSVTLHAAFTGSPGTGKTTFARYYAQEVRKLGVLKKGHLVEVSRPDLVAEFAGQTATKTAEVVKRALGGVLFIDEAYALKQNKEDAFGQECIDTLLKFIEDHRDEMILILAGYTVEMRQFLHQNPGLKSRIPNEIVFEDFSLEELGKIFDAQLGKAGLCTAPENRKHVLDELAVQMRSRNFGNARAVRNLFERALAQQSARLAKGDVAGLSNAALCTLVYADFTASADDVSESPPVKPPASSALERLNALTGLEAVKKEIRDLVNYARLSRLRQAETGAGGALNLNLVLEGNPGTGKRTVAKLLGEIFRDAGLLPSGHLVETDRAGLVSGYLGQTATQTREKVTEAVGGVLHVAEAYALCRSGSREDAYGQEAVDALVKSMDDNAGRLVVVLSGYPAEMEEFLDTNAGLRGRFAKTIAFPDYDDKELAAIAEIFARERGLVLSDSAKNSLDLALKKKRGEPGFANARTAVQLVEAALKRQASRLLDANGALVTQDPKAKTILEGGDFAE